MRRGACAALLLVSAVACHATTAPAVRPTVRLKPDTTDNGPALSALQRDIDALIDTQPLAHSYWGVLVKSLGTGETLYERNAQRLLMPASNMKIVTLAAAAERLGWDYTYATSLFAAGSIDDGTLHGDLVVAGSGDPSVTAAGAEALFAGWADALRRAGVHAVTGRVIGDDNAFEDNGLGFGWSWDDLADDYAAGVSALQFNENAVQVTIAAGPAAGDSAGVTIAPPDSGLSIVNAVTTAAPGTPTAIAARRLPGSMRLELTGTIAAAAPPAALTVSVDNPTLFFAAALRAALIARGIDIRGPAVDIDDLADPPPPRGASPIATHRSPPLSTLALRLMKDSQNLYAETLLKTLSARAGAAVATAEDGRRQVAAALQPWGVGPDSLIQRDGSGLSRYDYVTAAALVGILTGIAGDERLRGPFDASLPIAGRDGSLASRMKNTSAEGNARAKTGSMSNVRALSGYVTSGSGEPLVFAIVANNFDVPGPAIIRAIDAIVVRLATFAR